jgi:outer membrane immunogenic protein
MVVRSTTHSRRVPTSSKPASITASAARHSRRRPTAQRHTGIFKAPVSKAPPSAAFSWTGCYAGVHGGGGWMLDTNISANTGGGGLAGGQLGCNVQAGAIVWGVEGEAAWSGLTSQFHSSPFFGNGFFGLDGTTHNRWSADVAARAGVAVDRALVYGKAGLAAGGFAFSFADTINTIPEVANGSGTLAGLLLGAGIEYAVTPNWSVKLEYDHIDYFGGNAAFNDNLGPFLDSESATTNVVKLGVNYRFGQAAFGEMPFAPAAERAGPSLAILKAPAYKAPVAANYWTGCYVGVQGGGGVLADTFANSGLGFGSSDTFPLPESSGGFAGGQLGCDVQTGALVFGLQGEATLSHIVNRLNLSSSP